MSFSKTEDTQMLDAALAYLQQGFAIVPTYSPLMFPPMAEFRHRKINKWHLFTGKITLRMRFYRHPLRTEKEVRYWYTRYPQANIKIATGEISNIIVLDVDYYAGGREMAKWLNLPETRRVETGDGCHYYFRYPKGMQLNTIKVAFGPSISFMANRGAVALPPSLHGNGIRYRWHDENAPIAPFPLELLEKMPSNRKMSYVYQVYHFYFRYRFFLIPLFRSMLWIKNTPYLRGMAKYF